MTMKQFVNRYRVRVSAEWADANPNMSDMPAGSSHWKVTLRVGRRQLTTFFSQGPAISHEPQADDVLGCLVSDATSVENAGSFEDWCRDMGMDTDSRRAERIYRTCERAAEKLHQLLGDEAFDIASRAEY